MNQTHKKPSQTPLHREWTGGPYPVGTVFYWCPLPFVGDEFSPPPGMGREDTLYYEAKLIDENGAIKEVDGLTFQGLAEWLESFRGYDFNYPTEEMLFINRMPTTRSVNRLMRDEYGLVKEYMEKLMKERYPRLPPYH